MKIKSRDLLISEYNARYTSRTDDPEKIIQQYLSTLKNPDKWVEKARDRALRIIEERKYSSIHILMYEYPMKTDRPRTAGGHTFSPNASANKNYFDKALKKVVDTIRLITTPAEITIEAYIETPSTVPPDEVMLFEVKLLNPVDRPDYDNIEKCYTDMLTAVLTADDDVFYHAEITKYYSLVPRVVIDIRYLQKHESNYIYKKLKNRKSIKAGIESGQIVLEKIEL